MAQKQSLKSAERKLYWAQCRVKNLESYLDRIPPSEFDSVMRQLDAALDEVEAAGLECIQARYTEGLADFRGVEKKL